ncbi:AtpZ/AtpI family protein [Modestobacter lapidis]
MGWAVTGTLMSGMAVWGGAGWLIDQWLDTRVFFALGVILGVAVAIYVVVKKYGAMDPVPGQRAGSTPGGRRSQPRVQGQTQKGQR